MVWKIGRFSLFLLSNPISLPLQFPSPPPPAPLLPAPPPAPTAAVPLASTPSGPLEPSRPAGAPAEEPGSETLGGGATGAVAPPGASSKKNLMSRHVKPQTSTRNCFLLAPSGTALGAAGMPPKTELPEALRVLPLPCLACEAASTAPSASCHACGRQRGSGERDDSGVPGERVRCTCCDQGCWQQGGRAKRKDESHVSARMSRHPPR
jgi:hypothetical protein